MRLDDALVILGGIVPEDDISKLKQQGVAAVFLPGTSTQDIAEFLRHNVKQRDSPSPYFGILGGTIRKSSCVPGSNLKFFFLVVNIVSGGGEAKLQEIDRPSYPIAPCEFSSNSNF